MVKNTYGTGCFMLMHTGSAPVSSGSKLVATAVCPSGQGAEYALEGSVFVAGAVVQWLRDGLGIIRAADEIEALAQSVKDNGGVYLVPAFAGLGSPHWDPYARGAILGLTRGASAGHLARAALEGIAYQTVDVLHAMENDSKVALRELRVDGGATRNSTLMQFQADVLGVPVDRPELVETTAAGSAFLAGLAVGFWSGPEELRGARRRQRLFEPAMDAERRERLYAGWKRAVERVRGR